MIRKSKAVDVISKTELESLHTGSLLSRLQRLRECEESFDLTDLTDEEKKELRIDGRIHVKDSEIWKRAFFDVKSILDTREHHPTAAERKERRISRAKKSTQN